MESWLGRKGKEASSSSSFLLRPTSPLIGLGLAVGLSLLTSTTLILAQPPKPLSVAVKLASSALSGAKALPLLQSAPETLLLASKTLVKGYKVSKKLNLVRPESPGRGGLGLSKVVQTLKPWLGAIGVVRLVASPVQDLGFLGLGLLSDGYRFSKHLYTVVSGVAGLEMDAALKKGFESLGLVVKAVKVAEELGQIGRCGGGGGRSCACLSGFADGDHCVVIALTVDAGCEKRPMVLPADCCFSFSDEVGNGIDFAGEGTSDQAWVSDLLCLSIPLRH